MLLLSVPAAWAASKKTVLTTIAQIGQPLAVIAGDRADIRWLLGEGVDPHLYKLTRSDVAKLTAADLILYNGLHLEARMGVTIERLAAVKPVVAVAETLPAERLLPWAAGLHDPHIWMDPALWKDALAAAVDALAGIDPANAAFYRSRAQSYFAELDRLRAYTARVMASVPKSQRALVTAHDAFAYFGRAFDVDLLAIQGISTESEAGLRHVEDLVATLVDRRIRAVFVETSVSERNVRALIDGAAARRHAVKIGGTLFSDAMGAPGTYLGTYIGMIDHNVTVIARALGGDAPQGGFKGLLVARSN